MAKSFSLEANEQRLRIRFSREEPIKYVSHLDLMRLWERSLRRASIPISYSRGFSPHPRFSFASPLPVGTTSEWELMDLFLEQRIQPQVFISAVGRQLPDGISLLAVAELAFDLPSLQSQLHYAEYAVTVTDNNSLNDIQSKIKHFLNSEHIPWQHVRNKEIRKYDLREQVNDIWIIKQNNSHYTLGMRISASGRPEQVTAALGFTNYPQAIHRTMLIVELNQNSS